MKKGKILLTGDDGFDAIGIRTMVNLLRDDYELKIAGTKGQRSAIGGGVTFNGNWGVEDVDGIEAFWVSGNPADAVDFSKTYFKDEYDLIISGINTGPNIGNCNASGTFGAAVRALAGGLAPKAIAMSWDLSKEMWLKESKDDDVKEWLEYPGETAKLLIEVAMENELWGADILNVNFPAESSHRAKIVKPISKELIDYYQFEHGLNDKTHEYYYVGHPMIIYQGDQNTDAAAIQAGLISIVPQMMNLFPTLELLELIGTTINL